MDNISRLCQPKGRGLSSGGAENKFIQPDKAKLKFERQVVKAANHLAFERDGNRNVMQNPHGQNNAAITNLQMAELAKGRGRFIDQLINRV